MSQLVSTQVPALSKVPNEAAFSTPQEVNFLAIVEKNSRRVVKENSTTREGWTLNHSKLFSACCAEVKSSLGMEQAARLPQEVADKINDAIVSFGMSRLSAINPTNVISIRKAFHADNRNLRVTERITAVGENTLPLKEQLLGIKLAIGVKERRLKDIQAKPNPDYDLEKSTKEHIAKLELTKAHIEASIASISTKTN